MARTFGRPYATNYSKEDSPKLGQIALWAGKHENVIYSGNIEMEGEEGKYSVNLFYPTSEHTKAIYQGRLAKNYGNGWENVAYIDFFKSKSDSVIAVGFIRWGNDQRATMRVLLFRNNNESGKENAPKFKGFLVANEKDKVEDRPTLRPSVNTPVKPLNTSSQGLTKEKFDQGLF